MTIHHGIVIHDTDNSPRNCNSQRRHCYSFWPISLLSFTHVNALSQRNHLYPFISSKVNDKWLSLSIVEALNCRASALSRSVELSWSFESLKLSHWLTLTSQILPTIYSPTRVLRFCHSFILFLLFLFPNLVTLMSRGNFQEATTQWFTPLCFHISPILTFGKLNERANE